MCLLVFMRASDSSYLTAIEDSLAFVTLYHLPPATMFARNMSAVS